MTIQFQFHAGSIKTGYLPAAQFPFPLFQFHAGSIKTAMRLPEPATQFGFQFHAGSIKTFEHRRVILLFLGFNSTLVRLRRTDAFNHCASNQKFQFHAGSIKTEHKGCPYNVHLGFQFHAGSIKTGRVTIFIVIWTRVSIPRWFD